VTKTTPLLFAVGCLWLAGCPRPPDAPTTLDELCSYLFVHHPDEDPAEMAAGLGNLTVWLGEHWAETEDGVVVHGLDQETVDALDGTERSVEDIVGVAVASESDHTVDEAAHALLEVDQLEVHPDVYNSYSREYVTDLDCFMDHTCDRLDTTEAMDINLALGVTSVHDTYNQYLWVELEGGPSLVQRSWLPEQPVVTMVDVYEQFYINALVPIDGGHYRLQSTWMVNDQTLLGEDAILYMVGKGQQQNADNLEAWLDGE